jgi:cytidine deaminase
MEGIDREHAAALIEAALRARERSYSPYSHFQVGAALQTSGGKIYSGCNIENAAYSPTNCAERTAFFKAVSEGERSFWAIAIAGGPKGRDELDFCAPCGVCRQVMMEFCDPKEFQIILAKSVDAYKVYRLEELLPLGFRL